MYLDWKELSKEVFVVDIETDDLDASVIWCLCWRNIKTGETGALTTKEDIRAFFNKHVGAVFVGHNILKFDGPVLNKLVGPDKFLGSSNCIDTLVLSTLYSPSLDMGHSLDAWGQRLGEQKISFNDWSGLSDDMIKYCHQDVLITAKLFVKLINVLKKIEFSEASIWIQHRLTEVIHQQEQNGFYFNHAEALNLYSHIRHLEEELQSEIRSVFPPERIERAVRTVARKDGTPTAIYLKDRERYITQLSDDGTTYRAFEDVEFNIGSPKQRVDKLLSLGWKPRTFTKTGNPKPFDKGDLSPCLAEFLEQNPVPEVELIARWMAYNGRANMINTWLENLNERDSCIHGRLYVADTLRFRHQAPNTANIPAVRVGKDENVLRGESGYFTYEARDLWIARPGRVLVGTDASGLELRMLAHFLNDPAFTEQVVSGDPHQYNADLAGVTRPQAKTLIYACVPMDTQCLTKRGWKTYDQLEEGELVLTYNQDKNVKEWKPVLEKVFYEDAPVVEMSHGHGFSIRSTPNHRWFVSRRTGKKHRYRVQEVRTTETITEDCNIVVNAPMVPDESSLGCDWTKLPKYSTDWSDVILNMSSQERRAWLSGFMVADGYESGGGWRWSQLLGPLFEAALLASFLEHDGALNVSINNKNKRPMGCVLLNKKSHITGQNLVKKEHANQPVWCIRTENESFVIRQGNCITITGNTLYGAGDAKIAATLGVPFKEGAEIKRVFLERLGADRLIKECKDEQRRGRVSLCDGSRVVCPSPHAALNYKLQGSGARVMGLGAILLEKDIRRRQLDSLKVGDVHDEFIFDVHPDHAEDVASASVSALRQSGERLRLNVKIDGKSLIGPTWAHVH